MDGRLDECLAKAIWKGGQLRNPFRVMSARMKEKQRERLMSFQKRKTEQEGWPVSELMGKYGIKVEAEDGNEMGAVRMGQKASCGDIPTGRVRVCLNAWEPKDLSEKLWATVGTRLSVGGFLMGDDKGAGERW